jgi:hypothetical protein
VAGLVPDRPARRRSLSSPPTRGAQKRHLRLWLFHPRWWRRNFEEHGFAVVTDEPMGLFYTSQELLGLRLGLANESAWHAC